MTSRERIRMAVKHQEPDRVAVDFGGHRSSGIMAIAYARLKNALGITSGDIYVYDMIQQLAIVEDAVLDMLGVDTIEMGRAFLTENDDWKEWHLPDGTPCKIPAYINVIKENKDWVLRNPEGVVLGIQKEGCLYFEQTHFPLEHRSLADDTFDDLDTILNQSIWSATAAPGSHLAFDENGLQQLAAGAKKLRESTDRAIIGLFGGNLFETPQWIYRMDNYLSYLALYPDKAIALAEQLYLRYMENLKKWLKAVGPYIDVILFGDDLGGQTGLLLSPGMYRQVFKPFHDKMWHAAKKFADVDVLLHSCGDIEPLLNDLIDAGLDAVNPVQISCAGMDSKTIKNKYQNRICFWGGGCDTREILPHAKPEEIKDHVKRQIEILHPGGGFVFQQVHNIMADVPPENIIAMFEAIDEMNS